jgi:hypothetical protein
VITNNQPRRDMPFDDLETLMITPPVCCDVRCTLWEVFTPPRIAPAIRQAGQQARRSIDQGNFWKLELPEYQHSLCHDVFTLQPHFIFLSPPCTLLSQLMFSNWDRMSDDKYNRLDEALGHIDLTCWLSKFQHNNKSYYAFEHPAKAQTWGMDRVTNSVI